MKNMQRSPQEKNPSLEKRGVRIGGVSLSLLLPPLVRGGRGGFFSSPKLAQIDGQNPPYPPCQRGQESEVPIDPSH
jgi:hypothetical protein